MELGSERQNGELELRHKPKWWLVLMGLFVQTLSYCGENWQINKICV